MEPTAHGPRERLRRLARHLPPGVREAAKRLAARGPRPLRRLVQVSPVEESAPPDPAQAHVAAFVLRHAADVPPRGDAVLTTAGPPGIPHAHVVDADPSNRALTVVADLAEPGSLPPARFELVLLTDGLDDAGAVPATLANAWQALGPGGILLAAGSALGEDELARACPDASARELESGPGVTCARIVKAP